jgi:hypothetical protein
MTIHDGDIHVQITSKALGILDISHPIRKMAIRLYHSKVKLLIDITFILAFLFIGMSLDYTSLESRATAKLSFEKNFLLGIMYSNSVWVFLSGIAGRPA